MIYLSTEGFNRVEVLYVNSRSTESDVSLYSKLVELGVFDSPYTLQIADSSYLTPSENRLFRELVAWRDYQESEYFPVRPLVLINLNSSCCVTLLDYDMYRS